MDDAIPSRSRKPAASALPREKTLARARAVKRLLSYGSLLGFSLSIWAVTHHITGVTARTPSSTSVSGTSNPATVNPETPSTFFGGGSNGGGGGYNFGSSNTVQAPTTYTSVS